MELQRLQAWNKTKILLENIKDPKAKKLYHDALLLKAVKEWGFNPEKPVKVSKYEKIEFTEYEKQLLNQIKATKDYGISVITDAEREKTEKGLSIAMLDFVRSGGQLNDIPERLQSPSIAKGYFNALEKFYG